MAIIDFILHIDKHLIEIINNYGALTYGILFLIIFCETGLVVTPFLPGDSLLFVAGALCGMDNYNLNVFLIWVLILIAAILGDALNYTVGKYLGEKLIQKNIVKQKNIEKTQNFFQKHGAKTIVLARFVPIVRTIAPFLAGSGKMKYRRFFQYNVIGALAWTSLFIFAGYFFGNIPIIKENITLLALGIVIVSLMPMVVVKIISMRKEKKTL